MGLNFYRVIQGQNPTTRDFLSQQALGIPLRDPARRRDWAEGISVLDTLEAAKRHASKYRLGRYVVPLAVPGDGTIEVRQTGGNPSHYTIYATPEVLLGLICGPPIAVEDERNGCSL